MRSALEKRHAGIVLLPLRVLRSEGVHAIQHVEEKAGRVRINRRGPG